GDRSGAEISVDGRIDHSTPRKSIADVKRKPAVDLNIAFDKSGQTAIPVDAVRERVRKIGRPRNAARIGAADKRFEKVIAAADIELVKVERIRDADLVRHPERGSDIASRLRTLDAAGDIQLIE